MNLVPGTETLCSDIYCFSSDLNNLTINYTWRSGRIFGVPVDLHWSFLLIPFAILYFSWGPEGGFNQRALTWYSSVAVLLFLFILFHELGHALAAKNRGVRAERIILFPLGGGAYLPEQPKKVWAEVFVYAAGPLANLVLAGLGFLVLLQQADGWLILRSYVNPVSNTVLRPTLVQQLLGMTVVVNLLLAFGNLLPAYPLDGGRILRALLRRPVGARRATVIVTVLGVIIGVALIVAGYLIGDYLLVAGALFIIGLSVLEYRNGWQRRLLSGKPLSIVLRTGLPNSLRLYPNTSVALAKRCFEDTGWPVLPVHNHWNELVGFVEATHLAEDAPVLTESLTGYFEPEFVAASANEDLLVVTEKIVDANVYGAVIVGKRGSVEGYVFTEDVIQLLDRPYRKLWRRIFK